MASKSTQSSTGLGLADLLLEEINIRKDELDKMQQVYYSLTKGMPGGAKARTQAAAATGVSPSGRLLTLTDDILACVGRHPEGISSQGLAEELWTPAIGMTLEALKKRILSAVRRMNAEGLFKSARTGRGKELAYSLKDAVGPAAVAPKEGTKNDVSITDVIYDALVGAGKAGLLLEDLMKVAVACRGEDDDARWNRRVRTIVSNLAMGKRVKMPGKKEGKYDWTKARIMVAK